MEWLWFLLLGSFALGPTASIAQRYPMKPIHFITAGGPNALGRILGQKFTEAWGQQVIVEEHGGGGGMMSVSIAARAPAGGILSNNSNEVRCGLLAWLRAAVTVISPDGPVGLGDIGIS